MSDQAHPDEEFFLRQAALDSHFRPSAPVDTNNLLKGRTEQIGRLLGAVSGVGEHAAIYGEPGVGKTSISLVAQSIINLSEAAACVRVQCSSDDNFAAVWSRFGEYLTREAKRGRLPQGNALAQLYESLITGGALVNTTPSDVFFQLDRLVEISPLVVIIDEFDRIADWSVRSSMSSLIKLLSDERLPVTLVIVGVGDDIADLVAEHTSIERNLIQIPMPRLEGHELHEILESGFRAADLEWEPSMTADVVKVSRGLPHYVHLMGRHLGRLALTHGESTVLDSHWVDALTMSVAEAQETVARQYSLATASHRQDALYAQVLLACALTPGDEWGFFRPQEVAPAYSVVMGSRRKTADYYRHLQAFVNEERDYVLTTRGEGRALRYRFKNPLLQPYVILRGLESGSIERSNLPPLFEQRGLTFV